jgi:N utilization substance protein B
MGLRRDGREAAVQFLFASELHGGQPQSPEERAAFWALHSAKRGAREYAEQLVRGVQDHQEEIDQRIAAIAENYRLERIANVDRNILRLAVYEILFTPDVPPPVVINEAIEIAKKFSAGESKSFVNGILDKIAASAREKSAGKTT